MNRRRNNKYKGKKYKKPLDNYLEKSTVVDDGNIINDAYNSIMKYAYGTTGINYYSTEEEKAEANAGGELSAGVQGLLGLFGGMGDMGSGGNGSKKKQGKNKQTKQTGEVEQTDTVDPGSMDGMYSMSGVGSNEKFNPDGSENPNFKMDMGESSAGGGMGMDALGAAGAEMGFAIASAEMAELFEGTKRYDAAPDYKGASQVLELGGKVYKTGGEVEPEKPVKKESKQERYFKKYIPAIQSAAEKLGINVDVGAVATQIALETGYVEGNGLATKNHNYGGIKARGKQPFTIEETREYFKNKEEADKWAAKRKENSLMGPTGKVDKKTGKLEYKVKTPFRKFETPEEGMMAQIKLITIPRYAERGTSESKGYPGEYFNAVAAGGYATSPTYAQKLTNLYNTTTLPILEQYFPGMGREIKKGVVTKVQELKELPLEDTLQDYPTKSESTRVSSFSPPEELQEYSGSVNAPETYSEKKTSKKSAPDIKTTYSKPSQMPNMNKKRGLEWFQFYENGGKVKTDPPFRTSLTKDEEFTFQFWRKSLPKNLQVDNELYDLRGAWKAGIQPELIKEDGTFHMLGRNPETGNYLKSPEHPTHDLNIEGDIKTGYTPHIDAKTGKMYSKPSSDYKYENGGKVKGDPNTTPDLKLPKYTQKSNPEFNFKFNKGKGEVHPTRKGLESNIDVNAGIFNFSAQAETDLNKFISGVDNQEVVNPINFSSKVKATLTPDVDAYLKASNIFSDPSFTTGLDINKGNFSGNIDYNIKDKEVSTRANYKNLGAYLNIPTDGEDASGGLTYNTQLSQGQHLGVDLGLSSDPTLMFNYSTNMQKPKQSLPNPAYAPSMETGGIIKEEKTIAEVEGGEAFETPNGEVGEFVGPDHTDDPTKESGIKLQVGDKDSNITNEIIPEGTKIYSKQISKNGNNMAREKIKSAKYLKSLEEKYKENPSPLNYNSLQRAMDVEIASSSKALL